MDLSFLVSWAIIWLNKERKVYTCTQCYDTGEIWGGWSGMDVYECDCRKEKP